MGYLVISITMVIHIEAISPPASVSRRRTVNSVLRVFLDTLNAVVLWAPGFVFSPVVGVVGGGLKLGALVLVVKSA